MKDIFDLNTFSSALPVIAIFVAAISALYTIRNFKLDQHRQKKNRLIDEAKASDNNYPTSKSTLGSLRSAIYDFCGKEHADIRLALISLNSETPGSTLEHFRVAGQLFQIEPESTWRYIGEDIKSIKKKHKLSVAYFIASLTIFGLFVLFTPYFFEKNNSLQSYIASFSSLLFFTIHSSLKAEQYTVLIAAIEHLKNKLNIS